MALQRQMLASFLSDDMCGGAFTKNDICENLAGVTSSSGVFESPREGENWFS